MYIIANICLLECISYGPHSAGFFNVAVSRFNGTLACIKRGKLYPVGDLFNILVTLHILVRCGGTL